MGAIAWRQKRTGSSCAPANAMQGRSRHRFVLRSGRWLACPRPDYRVPRTQVRRWTPRPLRWSGLTLSRRVQRTSVWLGARLLHPASQPRLLWRRPPGTAPPIAWEARSCRWRCRLRMGPTLEGWRRRRRTQSRRSASGTACAVGWLEFASCCPFGLRCLAESPADVTRKRSEFRGGGQPFTDRAAYNRRHIEA